MSELPVGLWLPPGRQVHLPGRGTTFVREVAGPAGAPTVILLHGLTASADLNWFPSFGPLGRLFRVVALDLRGHGRGIPVRGSFRLEDCADDVAALAQVLGLEPAIVVGYSLGGTVAQLVWRRHREVVAGLVLCSTGHDFRGSPLERLVLYAMPGITTAARLGAPLFPNWTDVIGQTLFGHIDDGPVWRWVASEMRRARVATIMSATHAVGNFSSHQWIREVDVPTAVVLTAKDQVVSPSRQLRLARAIPGATTHLVEGDHGSCLTRPHRFVPVLVEACRSVAARMARPVPAPRPRLVAAPPVLSAPAHAAPAPAPAAPARTAAAPAAPAPPAPASATPATRIPGTEDPVPLPPRSPDLPPRSPDPPRHARVQYWLDRARAAFSDGPPPPAAGGSAEVSAADPPSDGPARRGPAAEARRRSPG